jgi:MipA family protein
MKPAKYFLFIYAIITTSLSLGDEERLMRKRHLYEMGGGALWVSFPHYPGSGNNRKLFLPFPSVVYRGEVLRASRDEGLRGRFFNHQYLELDLSMDGTFPSKGKHNPEREGMPDLDAVIEFGPRILLHLKRPTENNKFEAQLHFATRYAFSSDIKNWNDRGIALNPFLAAKYEGLFTKDDVYFFSAGAKFASRKLMDYYYGVDQEYERTGRPAYHAKSGFLESSLAFASFYPVKNDIWIFGGLIKSFYSDAANKASPLLSRKTTTTLMVGFYWNFIKSDFYILE